MKRVFVWSFFSAGLLCSLCFAPVTSAQDAPKPYDPSQQTPSIWKQLPEIIPVATDDGGLDVAWLDHSETPAKLYLSHFTKGVNGYTRTSSNQLEGLGLLAGFTRDNKGNTYYMTAEPSAEGKEEDPKTISLYKNDQVFWNFQIQDGDSPPTPPKLPFDNGTSRIVTGAGKLFVDINLLPAHAYNVILDLDNPDVNATRYARETLYHHNMGQSAMFDGKDFVAIENRDHEVTLSMMKFSPTEKYPFEPYAERLRSVYTRTNNGNSVFTELGGIAPGIDDSNGYLVLFSSERDWDNQMAGLTTPGQQTGLGGQISPRDLAVIHVKKDFDKQTINWKGTPQELADSGMSISQAPKLVDTTSVVNSIGTGRTVSYQAANDGWDWPNYNADIAKLVASGDLAQRQHKTAGVNWLTNYGVPFQTTRQVPAIGKVFTTVSHPKLVRIAPNKYIAVWEECEAQRATWDKVMSDLTYKTTKAMMLTLAAQGQNVSITKGAVKDLGKVRLMASDDPINLGGKAAWITGDEVGKALKINTLDTNLNLQSFVLPVAQ
ncbi:hypothetical protein IAD21_01896 [Abditibacteriota bacterium]|nr:hypothetical protein IAD21_01896 [Abditibacteriota bacterium]